MALMTDHEEQQLKDELAALKKALRLGIKSVTYGERTLTYRSIAEMRQIRRDLESELGCARVPKTWLARSTKGTS